MNLNQRLTKRAKAILLKLPKTKRVSVNLILEQVVGSGGLGSAILQNVSNIVIPTQASIDIEKLVKEAYYQALLFEHVYVGTEHILLALYKLTKMDEAYSILRLEFLKLNIFSTALREFSEESKNSPLISTYTKDITRQVAREIEKAGSSRYIKRLEYERLVTSLLKKNNSSVLLVGEPGVGKDSIIKYLAQEIIMLNIPPALMGSRVLEIDILAFMLSFMNKGGMEAGLSALVEELTQTGKIILSISGLQNIFFATPTGFTVPMFYTIFKQMLDDAGVCYISSVNTNMYERIESDNDNILENFTIIEVAEPSKAETIKVLGIVAGGLEEHYKIRIPAQIIEKVYVSANKLEDTLAKFPKKGVDLLDTVCSAVLYKRSKVPAAYKSLVDKSLDMVEMIDSLVAQGRYDKATAYRTKLRNLEERIMTKEDNMFSELVYTLTVQDVDYGLQYALENTTVPVGIKTNIVKLTALGTNIKTSIIGQEEAVDTVAKALIRAGLGLRASKRPLTNMLFLGPTGVGKTELGKVLASEYFGPDSLIRLDMSDFSEKHMVARLVGSPPGYVGYGEGGELTTKIAAKPDSVVLFDEIEKAHPDVLNVLLQIMEEGELIDAKGQTFDFSKSVVILTSNLGTDIFHKLDIGFVPEVSKGLDAKSKNRLEQNLKKIMKPELLNRFDDIIYFKQLLKEDQMKILDLLIGQIKRTLKLQSVNLALNKSAKEFLIEKGYSVEYGARGLRRSIEKELLDKVAEVLLARSERPLSLKAVVEDGTIKIL